jgi:glycosyltransferase involved in cell wall biosynthesis
MKHAPTVSICIPTYNQTKYLRKVLDSVFEQTFTDYEVIISDDSTNNDVKVLIDEYINSGKAIRYIHHSPSLGSPRNWNYALKIAQGEYIKIMHHDDYFTKNESLKILVDTISKNPNSFVFSYAKSVVNGKESYFYSKKELIKLVLKDPLLLLLTHNLFGPPSGIIYKKGDDITFDENLIWFVDLEFYIQLLNHKKIPKLVEDVLYISVHDTHNITNNCINNKPLIRKEFMYTVKKHIKNKGIKYTLMWNYQILKMLVKSYMP